MTTRCGLHVCMFVVAMLVWHGVLSAEIEVENQSQQPFHYEVRYSEGARWSDTLSLNSGKVYRHSGSKPLVIRFRRDGAWKSYRLEPGNRYSYRIENGTGGELYLISRASASRRSAPLASGSTIDEPETSADSDSKPKARSLSAVGKAGQADTPEKASQREFSRPRTGSKGLWVGSIPRGAAVWLRSADEEEWVHAGYTPLFVEDIEPRLYYVTTVLPLETSESLRRSASFEQYAVRWDGRSDKVTRLAYRGSELAQLCAVYEADLSKRNPVAITALMYDDSADWTEIAKHYPKQGNFTTTISPTGLLDGLGEYGPADTRQVVQLLVRGGSVVVPRDERRDNKAWYVRIEGDSELSVGLVTGIRNDQAPYTNMRTQAAETPPAQRERGLINALYFTGLMSFERFTEVP